MAPPSLEAQYKDLLNPIKSPEQSFAINMAEMLQDYIANLARGRIPPNFNSAALLVQGSISIFSKKVEYLHELARQLYKSFLKIREEGKVQREKEKEKTSKEPKTDEQEQQLISTDIKIGKNLSCLRRKAVPKPLNLKKGEKQLQVLFSPVQLLSLDDEEKGGVFYDVRGEAVGNKFDFTLNKCKITSSGWLLLPTIRPDLVPSETSPLDYDESDISDDCCDDSNVFPASSENTQSTPSNPESQNSNILCTTPSAEGSQVVTDSDHNPTESDSQNTSPQFTSPSQESSQLTETDNGTPNDAPPLPMEGVEPSQSPSHSSPEGRENVPDPETNSATVMVPMPVRRSIRQALKVCQLAAQNCEIGQNPEEMLLFNKVIQKKNTCSLPSKLRLSGEDKTSVYSASEFCSRTFFSMDSKVLHNGMLSFEIPAFGKNSKFFRRLKERLDFIKSSNRKNRKIDAAEDEEIDIEGIEVLKDPDPEEPFANNPLIDDDIHIDNDPDIPIPDRPDGSGLENPIPEPAIEEPQLPSFQDIAFEEVENYADEIQKYVHNSDITERVQDWESKVKPFLEEIEQRENFDINLYGSRILNAFEDNNRKQTMTFRTFCKDMEKWQIHRYFMALLPLANIGNVAIDTEQISNDEDEILVTLLSRKMHHKELEEFGHVEGSHS